MWWIGGGLFGCVWGGGGGVLLDALLGCFGLFWWVTSLISSLFSCFRPFWGGQKVMNIDENHASKAYNPLICEDIPNHHHQQPFIYINNHRLTSLDPTSYNK